MSGNNCSLSLAFKIGLILCIVGLLTITVGLFIVPLVADRVCGLQRASGQKAPGILNYTQVDEECTKVLTTGFLAILSVPAILLLLVGLFILIMAGTNRILVWDLNTESEMMVTERLEIQHKILSKSVMTAHHIERTLLNLTRIKFILFNHLALDDSILILIIQRSLVAM